MGKIIDSINRCPFSEKEVAIKNLLSAIDLKVTSINEFKSLVRDEMTSVDLALIASFENDIVELEKELERINKSI